MSKIRLNDGTEIENVSLCAENSALNSLLVIVIGQATPADTGRLLTTMSAEGVLATVEVLTEKLAEDGTSQWETEKTVAGYSTITGVSYNAGSQELTVFVGR